MISMYIYVCPFSHLLPSSLLFLLLAISYLKYVYRSRCKLQGFVLSVLLLSFFNLLLFTELV
ncbi:hypothetical protein I7I50_10702 [Histoplasma capsulatum G186AR]|uniref:Uncharacterized protein n=1 Tax=Ajellomyces capsulatus TaxID=5037 RepID=A0A8H7Z7Y4_AJECA|nr:hypothetical protein I7I52_01940 [Histoplasma capsulatum]QSS69416.1 hypothetical protein I7I50_10702 [Histoplasma capsulatum G186AR]